MMQTESRAPLGVVLTAGAGTRLRPLTPALTKPQVPLLNRPLIAYALDLLHALGLEETVVVLGGGDHQTEATARTAAPEGLALSFAVQEQPRGPGDAVVSVGAALDDRVVVVLAVDTVLPGIGSEALDAFLASDAVASLVLKQVPDPRAFGVAVMDGDRVEHLEEKPAEPRSDLALVGLWLLRPAAVERLRTRPHINAKGESDLTATIGELVEEGAHVTGWEFAGDWLDGGTLEGLLQAQAALLPRLAPGALEAAAAGARLERTSLSGAVLLAPGVRVEDSRIEDSVVGEGATLHGVHLARALVMPGARLTGGEYRDVVVTAAGEAVGPGVAPAA